MLFSQTVSFHRHTLCLIPFHIFNIFFLFMYGIKQHCLICRPSDSTVSEDAGTEPKTLRLWHWQPDAPATRLHLIYHSARPHPQSARSHPLSARSHPYSDRSHPHSARSHPHSDRYHQHSARSHPHSDRNHPLLGKISSTARLDLTHHSARSYPKSARSHPLSARSHPPLG